MSFGPPGSANPDTAPADTDVYVRPPKREEAPAWTPPPGTVSFVAATTAGRAHVPEDRKYLDNRRTKAYLLDGICIGAVPLVLDLASVVTEGAALVFVAITLIYYFLCEATTGQTVGKRVMGLRVVALDGTPATAKAISARTVLRVLESGPIGLIVYVLSGRRRRRLGDLLGGTVVVEAEPDPGRAPRSALTVLYPVAWLAASVVFFTTMGHGGDLYLSELDSLCEEANLIVTDAPPDQALNASFEVAEAEFAALASFVPPPDRRGLHEEIVAMELAAMQEARLARTRIARDPDTAEGEMQRLAAVNAPVKARYAELGLKHCAA
jgi:uncharacterized RDD family membrane protein YckC